jgi:hypothetical protein
MLVLALAMRAALGADQWLKEQCHKAVHIVVGHEDNIATLAAITTIRSTSRNKLLPAKAAATITSITRFGMHADFIDKFHARKVADIPRQVEPELEKRGSFACGSGHHRVLHLLHEHQPLD